MGLLILGGEPTQYMTTASVFSKRHQFMVAWGLIENQMNHSNRTNGTGQYFTLKGVCVWGGVCTAARIIQRVFPGRSHLTEHQHSMQNKPPHDLIVTDGRAATTGLTLGRITQAFTQPGSFITLIKLHIIKKKTIQKHRLLRAHAGTHAHTHSHTSLLTTKTLNTNYKTDPPGSLQQTGCVRDVCSGG